MKEKYPQICRLYIEHNSQQTGAGWVHTTYHLFKAQFNKKKSTVQFNLQFNSLFTKIFVFLNKVSTLTTKFYYLGWLESCCRQWKHYSNQYQSISKWPKYMIPVAGWLGRGCCRRPQYSGLTWSGYSCGEGYQLYTAVQARIVEDSGEL